MARPHFKFQVFVKPIGPVCNLACRYCYYTRGPSTPRDSSEWPRMPEALLEEYIRQHIAATRGRAVSFSWHGGEPTILGLDYFRKIVAIQRKHLPVGKTVFNGIQTNGLLLDEEWCEFLASERFGVGLSLDGPEEWHDGYRLTRGGAKTHRQVVRALALLQRHGVHCDILCAVHDQNVGHPLRVYRYLKEVGAQFISFLPIVVKKEQSPSQVEPFSVPARAYGEFLCSIFDEWKRSDIGRVSIQIFEEAIRPLQGTGHTLCVFRETCGDIPVVEHNGDFYPCDHFVTPTHRLGNILETPLAQLLESRGQRVFGENKRTSLPHYCRQCEVLEMCNGGCPKDRFEMTPTGEPGLNYLCPGLKAFFNHCKPFFKAVLAEAESIRARATVGRNDPCPCGSGLKYKKCCFGKRQMPHRDE